MNARQQVVSEMKRAYNEGRVNAMNIRKGYDVSTGENGWHWQDFGRSEVHYMGKSVAEVKEYIDEVINCRQ